MTVLINVYPSQPGQDRQQSLTLLQHKGESIKYLIDYTNAIDKGVIVESKFTIENNGFIRDLDQITITEESFTDKTTSLIINLTNNCWYGYEYLITNEITLEDNQVLVRYFVIKVIGIPPLIEE